MATNVIPQTIEVPHNYCPVPSTWVTVQNNCNADIYAMVIPYTTDNRIATQDCEQVIPVLKTIFESSLEKEIRTMRRVFILPGKNYVFPLDGKAFVILFKWKQNEKDTLLSIYEHWNIQPGTTITAKQSKYNHEDGRELKINPEDL